MRAVIRSVLAVVCAQHSFAFAQGQTPPEVPVECGRSISAKVGDATLQSMCLSDEAYPLRPMIVISRIHPGGSGSEILARFPFERECEWTPNMAQLVCYSGGWSPLAGAVFRKSSAKGCKSFYVCQSGCGSRHTPEELTVTEPACQYPAAVPDGNTSQPNQTSCTASEHHENLTICRLVPFEP